MTSNLSAFDFIQERSEATPGLFNRFLSALSANIAAVDSNATINLSGATLSIGSSVSIGRDLWVKGSVTVGVEPSVATRTAVNIGVRSDTSDYLYFTDESALRSNYILGSHVGGTADGLNIWDASGSTMIASFSKQSIRFFQNVVGPVFDVGGALASTYNAATYGTGADSRETRIQAAINQASIDGIKRVYVPASMYPYSASLVSFIYAVQMVREGGDWSTYDALAYGANSGGTGDSTAAVQAAITAAGNDPVGFGQKVVLPQGAYVITSTLTMAVDRVTLEGAGKTSSILYFIPAVDSPCVRIVKSGGTALIARMVVRQLGFQSAATNTKVKTGIQIWSGTEITIEDIGIVSGTWVNGSIGIQTKGREATNLHNLALFCDRPLVISKSSFDWIDCDHFDVSDFYGLCTIGSAGTVVEIDSGVVLTNTSFNGYQAWVGGQSGLGWNDSASTNVSYNVSFNNVRTEQATGSNGWAIYVNRSGSAASIYQLQFNNCYWSPPAQGVYLRRVASGVLFNNCIYSSSTNTAADFDSSVEQVLLNNCWWQAGSKASTTNLVERWRLNKDATTMPLPNTGFFSDTNYKPFRVADGSTNAPGLEFLSGGSVGIWYVGAASGNYLGVSSGGNDAVYIGGTGGVVRLAKPGSAIQPSLTFNSEGSLGFYRSAVSALGLSYGALAYPDGSNTTPSITYSSQSSLGLYRSGAATIAQSLGTMNLATNAVRLSMRTLAASSVTGSAVNTNVARDEVVFTIGGASGASLIISSGGTAYIFTSTASAILA